jgi:trypsin
MMTILFLVLMMVNTKSSDILGGNEVTPFSKPYIGTLIPRYQPTVTSTVAKQSHICGVILISPVKALTAAHCIFSFIEYNVYFHRHNESLEPEVEGAILRRVKYAIRHPEYNPRTNDQDVGVLLWDEPLTTIKPVEFYIPILNSSDLEGLYGETYGWGATSEGGYQSDVLRGVPVEFWSNERCARVLPSFDITDSMICAGGMEGKDACQGDSGGPIFLYGTTYLVGQVSQGLGCGRPGLPGIYSYNPKAMDFIANASALAMNYS